MVADAVWSTGTLPATQLPTLFPALTPICPGRQQKYETAFFHNTHVSSAQSGAAFTAGTQLSATNCVLVVRDSFFFVDIVDKESQCHGINETQDEYY
jgi:hypothetical protein